jgi:hypothetical protein
LFASAEAAGKTLPELLKQNESRRAGVGENIDKFLGKIVHKQMVMFR